MGQRTMLWELLATVAVMVSMSACMDAGGDQRKANRSAAEAVRTYGDAKRSFAGALNEAVNKDPSNVSYRIVAIVGAAYSIGQLLRHDSASPITSPCPIAKSGISESEWTPIPQYQEEFKFDVQASASIDLIRALGSSPSLAATVKSNREAYFLYTSLTQKVAYEDAFEKAIQSDRCKSAIGAAHAQGRPVLAIRGIISGKEKVASSSQFDAQGGATVSNDRRFSYVVDASRGFSVEEVKIAPLFYVVTMLEVSKIAKGGFNMRAPTSEELVMLGGIVPPDVR